MAVPGKTSSKKLSSTLSRGGAEDFDIFCEQCDRDDIRLPAFGYCVDCEEHLCQTCYNTHRRPKSLRHHQLLDKDHMPHKQNLSKSLKSSSSGKTADLTKSCPKHTNEIIKFFCHDHDKLICSVCVTLEHPITSCNVSYIPDISGQILYSTEFKETLKDIDKLSDKCFKITKDLKQRVAKSTTSLKNAIVEIENFRKEINKRLDELEMEVKNTATKIQYDNNNKLKTTETTCGDIKKSLQVSADTLKHLNTNKKAAQLFTELKKTQQLILHNENITTQLLTTTDVDEYTFESNQAIKKLLQNKKSLGTLRKKELKKPALPKDKAALPMKMSTPRNINVKTSSDKDDCFISGITVSPQNQLFAADNSNSSIKMIDIESGTIEQLLLESCPWDITKVTRDTLAVTVPDIQTIQFISFSSNSLSLKNKLEVGGKCSGISHHQGKLAVTFLNSAKLQIIDLKGHIEITVEKDSNGDCIFIYPSYVTINSHSIYVSDTAKNAVIWLNWQGEMIGRYEEIKYSHGITLLNDWSFLVTDRRSHCIYRVSGDCKNSTTILKNVKDPLALCWCAETSTLYLSMHSYNTESDNIIKMYKMM